MTVNRYIFQSPYSSQIQIGRPDSSTNKEEANIPPSSDVLTDTNQSLKQADSFQTTRQVEQMTETTSVANNENQLLNLYA